MFIHLSECDKVLDGERFRRDEVRYNLLHFICSSPAALKFRTEAGDMILGQTPGFNPWLWISPEASEERREELVRGAVAFTADREFPGITSEAGISEAFARAYAESRGLQFDHYMGLEAYECPEVIPPAGVPGFLERANASHTDTVAAYLAAFSREAFGTRPGMSEVYKAAVSAIDSGGLSLWQVDGRAVSMARIAHRSPRHARINDVYTPPGERKKGYASAAVAAVCAACLREGLTPMLYADSQNPNSNKVYRTIGFIHAGRLEEYRFRP